MKSETKNTKKVILAVVALVAVIAVLFSVYWFTKGKTSAGSKTITIDVIHKDESVKTFTEKTEREFLGQVLADRKIVEGEEGPYGLFITTVDGEVADDGNQEWWCLTKDGGQVNTSADQTPIADGDKYELTLTVGY